MDQMWLEHRLEIKKSTPLWEAEKTGGGSPEMPSGRRISSYSIIRIEIEADHPPLSFSRICRDSCAKLLVHDQIVW